MKKMITFVLLTACMLALLVGCSHLIPEKPIEETEAVTGDIAPFVYVNDTLYKQSSDQKAYAEKNDEFTYLGKIESISDGEPKQNFQSNDNILGCEVYQYGENIVVLINNGYWLYMKYGEQEDNPDDISEEEKMEQDSTYNLEVKNTIKGDFRTYYEMSDGTWSCNGQPYKYRLEITGRRPPADKDTTFVYLSNIEEISFQQAFMASGFSSNMDDYFKPEEAVFIGYGIAE